MQKLILGIFAIFIFSAQADVLYIGDSHSVGCFGKALYHDMRELTVTGINLNVRSVATCGSSSASWLKNVHSTNCGFRLCDADGKCRSATNGTSPSLRQNIADTHPRVTVIALGSNMLKSDWASTAYDVAKLIAQVKEAGSQCIWIGPPQASTRFISIPEYELFVHKLSEVVGASGCHFVNSDLYTDRAATEKDSMGLHYGCEDAMAWANRSYQEKMQPILREIFK